LEYKEGSGKVERSKETYRISIRASNFLVLLRTHPDESEDPVVAVPEVEEVFRGRFLIVGAFVIFKFHLVLKFESRNVCEHGKEAE
jgi:hypothetical protein